MMDSDSSLSFARFQTCNRRVLTNALYIGAVYWPWPFLHRWVNGVWFWYDNWLPGMSYHSCVDLDEEDNCARENGFCLNAEYNSKNDPAYRWTSTPCDFSNQKYSDVRYHLVFD